MALTVNEGSSQEFERLEAGTYVSRCCSIIDLGTQTSTYEGETKSARKIMLSWEVCDGETIRQDGTAHRVSKRFTASLHAKSAMRKFLEAWRGRPFTTEELQGFELTKLPNMPCLLGVVRDAKDGKEFVNVTNAVRLAKGMTAQELQSPAMSFDLDKPDWKVFAEFGKRLQDTIMASPEFKAVESSMPKSVAVGDKPQPQRTAPAPAATSGSGFDDMADDIPF